MACSNRVPASPLPGRAVAELAEQIFPNLSVALRSERVDRRLASRRIGHHTISHILSPQTTVEGSGERARQAGVSRFFKLIWPLQGNVRYQDQDRSFVVRPGEVFITALAGTYYLEMDESYAGLVLMVDPASKPGWQQAALGSMDRPAFVSGPLAAVAAGAEALLRHPSSSADAPTIECLIDVALQALGAERAATSEQLLPAIIVRARLMVGQHINDEDYGPDRLARDLGLSRRSLYNAFGRIGLTPALFIKRERLDRAKADLLKHRDAGITMIALRNGFSDGATFSHAFRAQYGLSPRELRGMSGSALKAAAEPGW